MGRRPATPRPARSCRGTPSSGAVRWRPHSRVLAHVTAVPSLASHETRSAGSGSPGSAQTETTSPPRGSLEAAGASAIDARSRLIASILSSGAVDRCGPASYRMATDGKDERSRRRVESTPAVAAGRGQHRASRTRPVAARIVLGQRHSMRVDDTVEPDRRGASPDDPRHLHPTPVPAPLPSAAAAAIGSLVASCGRVRIRHDLGVLRRRHIDIDEVDDDRERHRQRRRTVQPWPTPGAREARRRESVAERLTEALRAGNAVRSQEHRTRKSRPTRRSRRRSTRRCRDERVDVPARSPLWPVRDQGRHSARTQRLARSPASYVDGGLASRPQCERLNPALSGRRERRRCRRRPQLRTIVAEGLTPEQAACTAKNFVATTDAKTACRTCCGPTQRRRLRGMAQRSRSDDRLRHRPFGALAR